MTRLIIEKRELEEAMLNHQHMNEGWDTSALILSAAIGFVAGLLSGLVIGVLLRWYGM